MFALEGKTYKQNKKKVTRRNRLKILNAKQLSEGKWGGAHIGWRLYLKRKMTKTNVDQTIRSALNIF